MMNAHWEQLLGATGARLTDGRVDDFGNQAQELLAARDATVIAPLLHLGLIECAGEDSKGFLHNQFTSDINHLAVDAAQHSAWCSPKGRMLASFLIFRNGPACLIQLAADLAPAIQKRLQMFILRSRVKLLDRSPSHCLFGLSGAQAEQALLAASLPVPSEVLTSAEFADGKVIRLSASRFEVYVAGEAAATLWQALAASARPVGTTAWQWLDIQAGIPLIGEATREEFVPQMANFEKIGGVSFHKGCYPGQEVVARTQYLGKVKRHLYRLNSAQPIRAGTPVFSSENPEHACGMVANAAPAPNGGFEALAVIQENFVANGHLELGQPGGERCAAEPV